MCNLPKLISINWLTKWMKAQRKMEFFLATTWSWQILVELLQIIYIRQFLWNSHCWLYSTCLENSFWPKVLWVQLFFKNPYHIGPNHLVVWKDSFCDLCWKAYSFWGPFILTKYHAFSIELSLCIHLSAFEEFWAHMFG